MPSIISAGTTANTGLNLTADTSGNLVFQTNGNTTAMTIDTSQNVTYANGVSFTGVIAGNGANISSMNASNLTSGTVASARLPSITSISNGTSNVVVNSSGGTVSIATNGTNAITVGTTQTTTIAGTIIQNAALFQMNGNGNADLRLINTAGTSGRRAFDWLSNGDNLRARLLSDDGGSLITDNLLVINWDGNVIMGNSSWDYSVNGFGFGAGNSYSYFTRTSGFALGVNRKTTTGDLMAFWYNQSAVGNVSTNGSNCTFNSTSDYRLKQNIQPMTGALARVAKLKPVTYNWIRENQAGEGFIAHELQEVVPEAVTGTKDAVDEEGNPVYQAIDQSVLVATLTAAIQELKAELDATKAEVAALKGA